MNREPVRDINISSETKLSDLISQFGESGGFVAFLKFRQPLQLLKT